jgi:hypothetical protein
VDGEGESGMTWLDTLFGWLLGLFGSSDNDLVKTIREKTVEYCGFLPTVETVAALIAVNNPALTTGFIIAKKICAAVTAQKMSLLAGEAPIIVDGVVVEGEFISKGSE